MGIVIEGEYSTTQGNNFQRMSYQGMSTSAELFGGRYGNTSKGDVADDLPAAVRQLLLLTNIAPHGTPSFRQGTWARHSTSPMHLFFWPQTRPFILPVHT
jgi:hypothetical protein